MADQSRIPLIYIAGSSHSGSTLIDLVLGSHSLIESLGEAKKIPKVLQELKAGNHPRPLCSCHAAISDCDFWKSVLQLDIPEFARVSRITLDSSADLELARRALAFRGKTILLDSSKNLGRLGFLAAEPGFSTTCLHLTRARVRWLTAPSGSRNVREWGACPTVQRFSENTHSTGPP